MRDRLANHPDFLYHVEAPQEVTDRVVIRRPDLTEEKRRRIIEGYRRSAYIEPVRVACASRQLPARARSSRRPSPTTTTSVASATRATTAATGPPGEDAPSDPRPDPRLTAAWSVRGHLRVSGRATPVDPVERLARELTREVLAARSADGGVLFVTRLGGRR